TVLAQQHFSTFSQRLAAFPLKIEVLSRFRTPKEQQTIIDDLQQQVDRQDILLREYKKELDEIRQFLSALGVQGEMCKK
ncbi:MAG: hypothetical protein KJ607_09290, partial [Bacteroidetes bacterium]|nr:hypothetical protein [Bacteroidota bacterium]